MAKIICDVCGTSYPENASQCPICGCASSFDSDFIMDDSADAEQHKDSGYTYVKGGRFSKSNVRKMKRGEQPPVANDPEGGDSKGGKNQAALILVAVCLVAIIAVVIFIALRFFGAQTPDAPETEGTTTVPAVSTVETTVPEETTEPTQATTVATVPPVPCTEVVISKTTVELDKAGASVLLNVTTSPADTTDEIIYTSSDEAVATVSATGKVTAVAGGEAVITVTCGEASAQCNVVCTMEPAVDATEPTGETTESTEKPTTPADTESDFILSDLRGKEYTDITLSYKGENYKLYNGEVALSEIKWSSDNERVATFKDGVVKAIGSGVTTIYAEYNGVKRSCIVRCSSSMGTADAAPAPDGGSQESGSGESTGSCVISHEDVTIKVGETFVLTLVEADGDPVFATWSVGNTSVCSVTNNIVKGVARGQTTVSYTHNGQRYSCIVRVI